MRALLVPDSPRVPRLQIDLVADFTCPWSFLGKRRLERALARVHGLAPPLLRWHAFMLRPEPAVPVTWREWLAQRLPGGVTTELAEASLAEAGEGLGIRFDFTALSSVPQTREAHRLVKLAARESRHVETADAIFSAWFESARDIGDPGVLAALGAEAALSEDTLAAFRAGEEGRAEVARDFERLKALGVVAVPNLLLNGSVLVQGPADVDTYVQALGHALFPLPEGEPAESPTLH